MQTTRKIGLGCRPIVYANGADRQSGMWVPAPNLSKFKRLVCLKDMLPIIFLLVCRQTQIFRLGLGFFSDSDFFKPLFWGLSIVFQISF